MWFDGEGNTVRRVTREGRNGPTESENQGMSTNSMHGNREIPGVAGEVPSSVRSEKARGRTADMYAPGGQQGDVVNLSN